MANRLVLIRHGEIETQYKGRFIGSSDVSLSADGVKQAEALSSTVSRFTPAKCYCSPMLRAIQTADGAGFDYSIDSDLREVDFGAWEKLTFKEIALSYPEIVDKWADYGPDFLGFPEGEKNQDFLARVSRFGVMAAEDPADTVVAVTHGGVIRALICYFLGLDPKNYILFDVKRASVNVISIFDGRGILSGLNDLSHLEAR